jgi:predicted phosphodiesterase
MFPLTDDVLAETVAVVERHKGNRTTAAVELGITRSALLNRLAKVAREKDKPTNGGRHDLEHAGLKAENARLRDQLIGGKRLPVECDAIPPIEIVELWKVAEHENAKRIEHADKRHNFRLKLDRGPVCVSFISDNHISIDNTVDMRRMREDAELISETDGAYAILGGDLTDNHIKHNAAKLAARSQPHEQWKLCEYYLSILAEKIIVLIDGNHDKWTDQIAGIDMVSWIAKHHRLYYAPDEARIDLTVEKVLYKLAVRHQYRFNSSLNLLHTVKRWWAHGEEPFDIGAIGHHHEAAIESFRFHGQQCWGCRPGAYQITSAYSRQFGFNSTVPRAPSFILFPDERKILGFPDIRDALKTLKAER